MLGQYAQAEASLAKYLAHMPNDIRAARLIATAALQQQAASRGIEYLKPLVDKMPADAAALAVLGNAYMADRISKQVKASKVSPRWNKCSAQRRVRP
jgi:cytochrome c-type biogenesis protein CcmH/NrfG